MTDVAQQHLFLSEHLPSVPLRAMVIIVMNNRAAGVMPQRGCRHRRTLQVTAQVVDVLPGVFGLFRKVDFPASLELDLKELTPLPVIPNMLVASSGQVQLYVALPQQCDDGLAPV